MSLPDFRISPAARELAERRFQQTGPAAVNAAGIMDFAARIARMALAVLGVPLCRAERNRLAGQIFVGCVALVNAVVCAMRSFTDRFPDGLSRARALQEQQERALAWRWTVLELRAQLQVAQDNYLREQAGAVLAAQQVVASATPEQHEVLAEARGILKKRFARRRRSMLQRRRELGLPQVAPQSRSSARRSELGQQAQTTLYTVYLHRTAAHRTMTTPPAAPAQAAPPIRPNDPHTQQGATMNLNPLGLFIDRYIIKDIHVQLPGVTTKDLTDNVKAVSAWTRKLLLPYLLPEEKAQLLQADRLGMPQFLLTLRQILERNPLLAKAIGVDPAFLRQLEGLYANLISIEGAADGGDKVAQDLRRLLTDQLKHMNDRIVAAAQKVEADPGADPLKRRQARQIVNMVRQYRQQRQKTTQARTQRAGQRQARAHKQQQALGADAMQAELKRALVGKKAPSEAAPPLPVAVAKPRHKPAPAVSPDERTPPEQWLSARPEDYATCATDLTGRLGTLGEEQLTDRQRAQLDSADPLMEGDIGAMLCQQLGVMKWLSDESGVKADQLEEAVSLRGASITLEEEIAGLFSGARDGITVVAALGTIVYQSAQDWLATQPQNDEIAGISTSLSGAHRALEESGARVQAQVERSQGRIKDITQQGEAQREQAAFNDTVERLTNNEAVTPEEVQAAHAYNQRLKDAEAQRTVAAQEQQTAAKKKQKRVTPRK